MAHTIGLSGAYVLGAYVTFLPFFRHYHSVAPADWIWCKEGDAVGTWLLIWGLLLFHPGQLADLQLRSRPRLYRSSGAKPTGIERTLSTGLPTLRPACPASIDLHQRLVNADHLRLSAGESGCCRWLAVAGVLAVLGAELCLALCLPWLALATLLLWRRSRTADEGALFVALLGATGFAVSGRHTGHLSEGLSSGRRLVSHEYALQVLQPGLGYLGGGRSRGA